MPFRIVRAEAAHLAVLAPLFDGYRQFYGQPTDLSGARAFLAARLQRDESVVFLALDEAGAGAGFTQLYPFFSSVRMRRLWVLNDLFVVPSARRYGVAQALMERARQWAVETGAAGLQLETAHDNHPAQALYDRLGWVREDGYHHYTLPV
jgi:GNAT superfamily N-acetyltransferase